MSALAALAAALAACGDRPGGDAVRDVQAFVRAVQTGDRAAFEGGLDRAALRQAVSVQVAQLARAQGLEVEGGPSEFTLDRMVSLENLRVVDADSAPLTQAVTAEQLKPVLRKTDQGRVCVHDRSQEKRCILVFAKRKAGAGRTAGWKLVDMPASGAVVSLPAAAK